MEIAKMRAGRLLWAKIVKQFNLCMSQSSSHSLDTGTSYVIERILFGQ